jgi:pimeloyl-ACP methyl ester carboxylesterase
VGRVTSRAVSADGTGIAYYVTGRTEGPTVLAVHGYPDNHAVWDGMCAELGDDFRVVTYDVRGTGESDAPAARAGYRVPRLVDDLHAVLDAVSDGRPVHLLGHDWGSVQSWPALTDSRLAGRIASYTSVSGPSLDHTAIWMRRARAHPRASARQFLHSYYIFLFQLPRLPELSIRRGFFDRQLDPAPYRLERDKINGLELYRANVLSSLRRPRAAAIEVPVMVLALDNDQFLIPQVCREAPAPYVRELRTRTIPGGHWLVSEQPGVVAGHLREFVGSIDVGSGP